MTEIVPQTDAEGGPDTALFRLIEKISHSQSLVARRVENLRRRLAVRTGLAGRDLDDELARELVVIASMRTALIGAAASLPWSPPLIGPWAADIAVSVGGALLQVAAEVELAYAVAAAYQVDVPPERMRIIAFWLVKLRDFDELQARALKLGVRLTVKKLVEKLIAIGLTRALLATTRGMMARRALLQQALEAPGPWYLRAIGYLGVPILAAFGWFSTQAVGRRAIAFFSELRAAS